MISVDLRSRVPIYEQIKTQIMELILVGVLKPHDQLPSVRQLAKDLSINFNTVKKAFGDLETEKVIYTLIGRGSFVAENALGSERLKKEALQSVRMGVSAARVAGVPQEELNALIDELYHR